MGQPVVDPFRRRNILVGQWIRHADRVASREPGRRRGRQPVARCGTGQPGVEGSELNAEFVLAQRRPERQFPGAAKGVDHRAFHEGSAEMGQQRGDAVCLRPRVLPVPQAPPEGERARRRIQRERVRARLADRGEHVVDFQPGVPERILGIPLRRQVLRRHARLDHAVEFAGHPQEDVRQRSHGGDAVFDGHAAL